MGNLSAPLMEVSRLLDLVPYLSTHSHISLKELSQEFGVSEKEMVKELTNLSMCGLPGYTPYELIEVYFDSGFVTINNHEPLDLPRALNTQEIAALYIGLQLVRDLLPPENLDAVNAVSELLHELKSGVTERVALNSDRESQLTQALHGAISRRKALEISYTSSTAAAASNRVIDPLEIIEDAGHIYLSAYCHRVNEYRTFRLDRIQILHEVDPPSPRLSTENHSSLSPALLELRVHNNARLHREIFSGEYVDGAIFATFFSNEWLLRTVISAGADVELINPAELRAEIASQGEKILALYSSNL